MFDLKIIETLKIDEKRKKNLLDFCNKILEKNSNIKSVCLYGKDHLSGDKKVVLHVLFVLENEVDSSFFLENNRLIKKFAGANIVPFFLTIKHIETSQDVFPLEFLNMKSAYTLVYGKDFLKDININMGNLRLECEQQLKGLLIRFYQIFIELGDDRKKLRSIVNSSLDVVFGVFVGILFLKNNKYFVNQCEILEELERTFNIDKTALMDVLKRREKNEYYDHESLNKYIRKLQEIAYIVDGMNIC